MITSLDNLAAGIAWWCNRGWGNDFLNGEYPAIYEARAAGVTKQWWEATVNRLGQWQAYRGRTQPNTKVDIHSRGSERLDLLGSECRKLIQCCEGEPSIADLSWERVAPFFAVAWQIKQSSVFASKLCHFTFPKLFIVMDNTASSVFEYEFYWRGMKDEWNRFPAKVEAKKRLAEAITPDEPHLLYPFETKILELSHIGYEHPLSRAF